MAFIQCNHVVQEKKGDNQQLGNSTHEATSKNCAEQGLYVSSHLFQGMLATPATPSKSTRTGGACHRPETGFGETSQLDFSGSGTVGADLLERDFWTARRV
jgi:hypothetical protein